MPPLTEEGNQNARRNGGADDAGHIGTHGVHQEEVAGIASWPTFWETRAAMGHGGDTGGSR